MAMGRMSHAPTLPTPSLPEYRPVRHAVLERTVGLPFMVVRLYRLDGAEVMQTEPIGETRTQEEAVAIVRCEQGRARATNTSGRIVADNWQPIELRTA